MIPPVQDFIPDLMVKTQAHWKYHIKLPLGYVYKIYMNPKWISHLDLGPLPKIVHFIYIIFQNPEIEKSETFLVPSLSDKETHTYQSKIFSKYPGFYAISHWYVKP